LIYYKCLWYSTEKETVNDKTEHCVEIQSTFNRTYNLAHNTRVILLKDIHVNLHMFNLYYWCVLVLLFVLINDHKHLFNRFVFPFYERNLIT
jgi:hypothetical protein